MNNILDPTEFYGFHGPDDDNFEFSNWYLSSFRLGDIVYSSVEQYMMMYKANVFGDRDMFFKISKEVDPKIINKLGRSISGYNDHTWSSIRQVIVYQAVYAKFSQNMDLQCKLRSTVGSIICECSATDKIWGIGLSINDPDRFDTEKWNGANLLGGILMLVRGRLMEDDQSIIIL